MRPEVVGPSASEGVVRWFGNGGRGVRVSGGHALLAPEVEEEEVEAEGEPDHDARENDVAEAQHRILRFCRSTCGFRAGEN